MNSKKPSSLTRSNDDDLIKTQILFWQSLADILIGWNCAVSNNRRGAVSADGGGDSPNTHFMINISVQENCVVLTLNTCRGWSVMVSLGRFLTPTKRSEALRTSRPRKTVKETAWATNFMKGLRRIWPIWKGGKDEVRQATQQTSNFCFLFPTHLDKFFIYIYPNDNLTLCCLKLTFSR